MIQDEQEEECKSQHASLANVFIPAEQFQMSTTYLSLAIWYLFAQKETSQAQLHTTYIMLRFYCLGC